jgi:hypothetical protein
MRDLSNTGSAQTTYLNCRQYRSLSAIFLGVLAGTCTKGCQALVPEVHV